MSKYYILCCGIQQSNGLWDYVNFKTDKDPIDWLKMKRASVALTAPNSVVLVSFQEISKAQYDNIMLSMY